jgi:type I restriction enzyme R subunit
MAAAAASARLAGRRDRKKVPRPHQFFGVKAAQERIAKREGGVIWHTQGSGKSIVMVLLTKWILEHDPKARILVVTDRDELDKQIEGVMKNAGVIGSESPSPRITSRAEFVQKLGALTPRLLCALIHKFDVADLKGPPPPVQGRFYVFVDECHRTQGGDMNTQMKRWLEGAIFIGFTGTPLLRKDKRMTQDVFGTYIHTYKFHEGVADGVILDLKYEARDVPQRVTSRGAIDKWFEQKTKGLNNFQKAVLRKRCTLTNWTQIQAMGATTTSTSRTGCSRVRRSSTRLARHCDTCANRLPYRGRWNSSFTTSAATPPTRMR